MASVALAVVAACALAAVLASSSTHKAALLGEPFDSNLPVQWDRSADLDGLSRYFTAPTAHLRNGAPQAHAALAAAGSPRARTQALALLPEHLPTQMLGQDSDWHEHNWSPEHYIDVAASRVDGITAKGIWKNKDEAWDGIDKVLPTDTRYEYQTLHTGHGQEAKMEAFLDHAHHQLKLLQDALPKLAADKRSEQELDTLKGVIAVGEDALEKIERDTVVDDAHGAPEHGQVSDQDIGLSDKFKTVQGHQLRVVPNGMLDVQPDSVLNIDSSDNAVWAPGGDPFKAMGKPQFDGRSTHHAHYENAKQAQSEMNLYFASLDKKTLHENRKNARRAGESMREVEERKKRALDHSSRTAAPRTRKLSGGKGGVQQLRALHETNRKQARRFVEALARVLKPQQLQELKSSDDSCGVCMAVMGCKDCCELFCTDDADTAASAKPVPKCPKAAAADGDAASACDEEGGDASSAEVLKLEEQVRDLKKELKSSAAADRAQRVALEQEIQKVSAQVTASRQMAKAASAKRAPAGKAARTLCECTTAECKECPESDYEARARFRARRDFSAAQDTRQMQRSYPAADAKQFQKMLDESVAAASKAAVREVEKAQQAKEEKVGKGARLPCDCEDAECGNCPKQEQDARKGKGERGRGGDNVEARLAATEQKIRALQKAENVEAKLAATEKKNRALQKAEKAVAMSNAILREQVPRLLYTCRYVYVCMSVCESVCTRVHTHTHTPSSSSRWRHCQQRMQWPSGRAWGSTGNSLAMTASGRPASPTPARARPSASPCRSPCRIFRSNCLGPGTNSEKYALSRLYYYYYYYYLFILKSTLSRDFS